MGRECNKVSVGSRQFQLPIELETGLSNRHWKQECGIKEQDQRFVERFGSPQSIDGG